MNFPITIQADTTEIQITELITIINKIGLITQSHDIEIKLHNFKTDIVIDAKIHILLILIETIPPHLKSKSISFSRSVNIFEIIIFQPFQ